MHVNAQRDCSGVTDNDPLKFQKQTIRALENIINYINKLNNFLLLFFKRRRKIIIFY